MVTKKLLVLSADRKLCSDIKDLFSSLEVFIADTVEEAELTLLETRTDVLIYDLESGSTFTAEALEVICKMRPWLPVIVLTGEGKVKQDCRLLKFGIFYLLPKPAPLETLKVLVMGALDKAGRKHALP